MAENPSGRPDYAPILVALSKANASDDYRLKEKLVSAFLTFDATLAPIPDAHRASLIEQCVDLYDYDLGYNFRLSLLGQAYDIYCSYGLRLEAARCAYSIASIYDDEDDCPAVLLWTDRAIVGGADYAGIIQAYRLQVNCLSSVERYEGALVSLDACREHIRKYGADSPDDLAALCIIKASVYYEQGRFADAVTAYSDALKYLPELSPHRALITYNTGAVMAHRRFADEARILMAEARAKWLSADFRQAFPSYADDLEEAANDSQTMAGDVLPEPLGYWIFINR